MQARHRVAFLPLVSALSIALVSSEPAESSPASSTSEPGTLRRERLIEAVTRLGDVRAIDVSEAVDAAIAAETARYPAEILLSIAWGESRLIATTVTGRACGPMQTIPNETMSCDLMKVASEGFRAGVRELETWERDRHTHGRLQLVLLGYAAGYAAFYDRTHPKWVWPRVILWRARQLGYKMPSS